MKLVIATPLYPPEPGGPATYAKLLEEGLPSEGIEPIIVKFSEVRKWPALVRHLIFERKVRQALKTADAVLALDPVSTGLPALQAALHEKKPFFVKIVGDYAWEQGTQRFGITASLDEFVNAQDDTLPLPVRMLRKIQSYVASHAACVIVPSRYLESVVRKWQTPISRLQVIYNSVKLPEHGVVPVEVSQLPRPRIVTAARLVPWKGIDAVIDAVGIVGRGSLVVVGDGPLRGALEQKAKNTASSIVFTGALSHEDTLATIKDADVFVLNSSYEGLSHLLIEALAVGTPLVATRAGGNTELVEGTGRGVLIEVGDTKGLAGAIEDACTVPKDMSGEYARRFSPHAMVQALAQTLKNP